MCVCVCVCVCEQLQSWSGIFPNLWSVQYSTFVLFSFAFCVHAVQRFNFISGPNVEIFRILLSFFLPLCF